ncbi:MAG: phosphoglycerate kinase [Candidatus Woesearchaeota archaeon]|jgi:3-phosphoglycerate kinase
MKRFTLENYPLENKTVLVRVDFNVPLKEGRVLDNSKIQASLTTLKFLLDKNCKIVLMTHLGDPKGKVVLNLKTDPLAKELQQLLPKAKIQKLDDCIGKEIKEAIKNAKPKQIFLLENLRFYKEEEANDLMFAQSLASLAEVYIDDAFAVSHRNHASVASVAKFLPAISGHLMEQEIFHLNQAFSNSHPSVWMMGGAKLDKIDLIKQALKRADRLLIGGALAFTFLKSRGINVGMSKVDTNALPLAKDILKKHWRKIVLPVDFVVTEEFKMHAKTSVVGYNQIKNNQIALDIGPKTREGFEHYLSQAKIIVWNGPLGYMEWSQFAQGTKEIGRFLGQVDCVKIAGGGETSEAIHKFHLEHNFTHVSTGGGASLDFLSGKKMPGIDALQESYRRLKGKVK